MCGENCHPEYSEAAALSISNWLVKARSTRQVSCHQSSRGAITVARALKTCAVLCELNLSCNSIRYEGAEAKSVGASFLLYVGLT